PIHDLGVDGRQQPYFTMKLVEGETLLDLINTDPRHQLSDDELSRGLRIIIQTCEAIGYAHSRGVIHRDVKPENIMVGAFGEVYVMDWGIAQLVALPGHAPDAEILERRDEDGSVV